MYVYRVRHQAMVDEKLGTLLSLPWCYAQSATFPPAQAEFGRLSNMAEISKPNLDLRPDA